MPVGNDVVDLQDPESQPEALHPRWDSRVFSSRERRMLNGSGLAHTLRWTMWAAKESAFKAACKVRADTRFFPTAFVVAFTDLGSAHGTRPRVAVVRHEVGRFDVTLHESGDWVHAVATYADPTSSEPRIHAAVHEISSAPAPGFGGEEPGRARLPGQQVRSLARGEITGSLGLDPADIEIVTDAGYPVALRGGVQLPIDLSLSHHGRFVAYAWTRATGATGSRRA